MIIGSLLSHAYLWNVSGMEMGSTQRQQKWSQAGEDGAFKAEPLPEITPTPRHFHVHILFMLSIRNMSRFNI